MFVFIMGVIGSKSRSPGQILVKSCLHSLGYIFGLSTVTQVSDTGPSWPSCLVFLLWLYYHLDKFMQNTHRVSDKTAVNYFYELVITFMFPCEKQKCSWHSLNHINKVNFNKRCTLVIHHFNKLLRAV